MSYTTTGQTITRCDELDLGLLLSVNTTNADKVLQCYVNGKLAAIAQPEDGTAEFFLSGVRGQDVLFLLAVDPANAETDYFDDAFPTSADHANRILIECPQKIVPYLPDDRWRVYRGDAGDASAAIKIRDQEFYPGGRRACGFGSYFGDDGFGWDGHDAKGFGYNFGYGEFGFDCEMLQWPTQPLPPGVYPIKTTVVDSAGNESTASTASVEVKTYAGPASDLAVASYDQGTDTLNLTWTDSEDF